MKPKYAIAFGIIVVAAVAVTLLVQQGVRDEIWSTVAATGFVVALTVAFGGKCGKRRMCGKGEDDSGSWMHWIWMN